MPISEAQKLIEATGASVMLLNEETGLLEIISGSGNKGISQRLKIRPGEGIAGHIFLCKQAEIINDIKSDPRYFKANHQIYSIICATLTTRKTFL
ncbi:MAG: hypothetical protein F6K10_11320 [Moorea sp. SIO2B7]|nr:hypothetical protein [Moorena sp. SIO2B7]